MSDNRLYDLVFLIVPDKDEQGTLAVIEEFRKLLAEQGAAVEKDETMGRRRLAYPIKKRIEATYHNFEFRALPKAVTEIERKLRLSEDVLRYLTVRKDLETRHGQKVARRTKVRAPRPLPMTEPMAPPEEIQAAPVPPPTPATPATPATPPAEPAG